MEAGNRKLIRPSFSDVKDQKEPRKPQQKKPVPPDQTNAENFYFAKQIQMKTPMVVVLRDGEQLSGTVEWYDKYAFRLTRTDSMAVMIYKHNIKYMYKAE